jgi:NAD(P)-dependent dehydrogenase (short-subunit alcohol dehydrogenase family)
VAPGWVATPMAEESMKDESIRYQAMATLVGLINGGVTRSLMTFPFSPSAISTPLNKIATPMDVAYQIAILASQRVSGHVTGQIVRLHGGMEGELEGRRVLLCFRYFGD